MHSRASIWAFAVALMLAVPSVGLAQDKVWLEFKPEAGQKSRAKGTSKISFDAMGQKVTIEEKGTYEAEVLSADEMKSVLKSVVVDSTTTINGEPMELEADDEKSYTETTYARNGNILAIKHQPEMDDPMQVTLENTLALGGTIVFKSEPVGAGDSWKHDFPANDDLKTKAASSTYTVLALEELDGVPVAKIKVEFAEKSGSPAVRVVATHWIEIASGDSIKVESKVTGAQLDLGFGSPTVLSIESESNRSSGGLVKVPGQSEPGDEPEKGAIDEAVDGYEKIEGALTLWRKVENGRTSLKLELSEAQLGQMMMLQATASTGLADGVIAAGDPISDLVFEFRKMPNGRLAMYVPNYLFRVDNNLAIAKAVRRSFPDAIVESFAIEAEQEDRKAILIDVSELFRGDISRIATNMAGGGGGGLFGGGGSSYMLDRENSFVKTVKNFPKNLVVDVTLNFIGRGGGNPLAALLGGGGSTTVDDRSVVMDLSYNLFALPDNGYQPRHFDPRVGYFTNDYQLFSDPTAEDMKVMYINRWHLVKKDPTAAVSDPVEPITFWIDNATPMEYRDAVRDAILMWNEAFELAGFSNAVVAKQMPDDADFDHADMRYSLVRWITSPGNAYAIAQFRTNPLTGQILNGSVSVDANIVRAFAQEYGSVIRPEAWQDRLKARAEKMAHTCNHPGRCNAMAEGSLSLMTGLRASVQAGMISRDDYVKQFVKWVVGHEMGHMMGLRHNFVASTLLDLDELGNPVKVEEEGTSASMMDYVAFNPSALNKPGVKFYGDRVGRYDKWAIQYGYTDFPNKDANEERFDLHQIAQRGSQKGLMWLGDEYADSIDPYITRFDLSGDPLGYWTRMGNLTRQLLLDLPATTMRPGEGYYSFTREFNGLLGQHVRAASELTRFIGGVRKSNSFPNDPGAQKAIRNLPGKEQRAALNQVMKMVFAKEAFSFPKGYFKNFTMDPKGGLLESLMSGGEDYPMRDQFSSIQASVLGSIMEPGTLNRVINAEFEAEAGEDVLTLVELFTTVRQAVWTELGTGTAVLPLRRDLQRTHTETLMAMILEKRAAPAEAVAMARYQLAQLQKELATASGKTKDMTTAMHYADLADRIEKALDARPSVGATGGGRTPSLLDLLGGAKKQSGGGEPRG